MWGGSGDWCGMAIRVDGTLTAGYLLKPKGNKNTEPFDSEKHIFDKSKSWTKGSRKAIGVPDKNQNKNVEVWDGEGEPPTEGDLYFVPEDERFDPASYTYWAFRDTCGSKYKKKKGPDKDFKYPVTKTGKDQPTPDDPSRSCASVWFTRRGRTWKDR